MLCCPCFPFRKRKKVRPEPVPEAAIPRPQRVRPILRRLRKFLKREQALVAEGSVREAQTTGSEVTPHIPSEVSDTLITHSPNALQETAKEETKVIKAILHEDPVKMEDLEREEDTNLSPVPAVLGPSSSSLDRTVTHLMGQEVAKRGRSSRDRSPCASLTAPDNVVALLQLQQLKCRGLPNLGLTCYLNATLQCLLHLQPFCTQLLVQEEVWRMEPEALLLSSFVGLLLLRGSCEMDVKAAVLLEFKDQISLHNQEFQGNSQNDAHEFLSECLMRLRVIGQALAMGDMAYQCPVDTLLSFQLRYIRTCQSCGVESTRDEVNTMLSLDLVGQGSVRDSLQLFFTESNVEFRCECCEGRGSTLRCNFHTLPQVLILHLKRFCPLTLTKQHQALTLDPILDLRTLGERTEDVPRTPPPNRAVSSIGGETGTETLVRHREGDSVDSLFNVANYLHA
ncbi:ubiquitin carboxyl-terminal hydrolase 29-like [Clupea harengus]|uniref:Ubiquitin carboxyl-terminal hydrolase 29-like n=1 Tax=Clupea harengus TaxID=7950 RepID=A0A8M1KAA1_CLUHA|nr:ubiquitin carboxyl-terminal hydrolase 29-like [Clupea harengus]